MAVELGGYHSSIRWIDYSRGTSLIEKACLYLSGVDMTLLSSLLCNTLGKYHYEQIIFIERVRILWRQPLGWRLVAQLKGPMDTAATQCTQTKASNKALLKNISFSRSMRYTPMIDQWNLVYPI